MVLFCCCRRRSMGLLDGDPHQHILFLGQLVKESGLEHSLERLVAMEYRRRLPAAEQQAQQTQPDPLLLVAATAHKEPDKVGPVRIRCTVLACMCHALECLPKGHYGGLAPSAHQAASCVWDGGAVPGFGSSRASAAPTYIASTAARQPQAGHFFTTLHLPPLRLPRPQTPQLADYSVALLGAVYAVLRAGGLVAGGLKLDSWAAVEAAACKPNAAHDVGLRAGQPCWAATRAGQPTRSKQLQESHGCLRPPAVAHVHGLGESGVNPLLLC